MNAPDLAGKVGIVTGASGGVGRAYALALAGAGATVIAAARTVAGPQGEPARGTLAEVVASAAGLPGRVIGVGCDVTCEADVVRLVAEAAANAGGIDVLVNNAGAYPRHDALSITLEEWEGVMQLNLRSAFLTMREAVPHMRRRGGGSVINITAGAAGFFPKGHGGHENLLLYAISKAGVNRLTTWMAEELREDNIAVNALSPGVVRTDVWETVREAGPGPGLPGPKPATPEALGPAMLHLAVQRGAGITGQILHTDRFGADWP